MAILYNLGCKLNQYEGNCLLEKFSKFDNVVIVNTCCVTREAEVKSQKKLRNAIRNFPGYKVVATGCACTLNREEFKFADEIIDLKERNELIRDIFPEPKRARYFLKIEDGCNQSCTFCVVSKLRTKVESKPGFIIQKEIEWAKSLGFKEIVLAGANIGLYGCDIGSSLSALLKSLTQITNLPRIRLSSIEPQFITPEIISVLKNLPFCPHFHIPVQSADDRILSLMGRRYNSEKLKKIIELIIRNYSDAGLSGDIIVGFPGESEEEFYNTYNFIRENPFMHLHIFPYSPRPNTEAFSFGDTISSSIKKRRLWLLKELIQKKNYEFRLKMQNRIFDVVVERKNGMAVGLARNYIRIMLNGNFRERDLVLTRVERVTIEGTYGTVIA
uniref:MiaB/RimO family radical SAM methylthiotransferase n=1 Tax=candidate division WOR-3 bacterium TaxID=2052148 RepID=A0A7C4XJX2_UNCW3